MVYTGSAGEGIFTGCSKSPSSKAAGSSATEAYPCGTLQGDGRLRTMLAGFFSIRYGFCRKRNELYNPAMAIVTSSIVSRSRLTMASGVGGLKIKCRPRNSGACDGGVSQGGKRIARESVATMPYRISTLSCPGLAVTRGGDGFGGGEASTWSA
jgi:hypothetical protein